ncbi:hypothetical protein QFZ32_001156 [Streptomyces canus]|nr:hypothetical protein [Streptomyces canus]
MRGDGASGFLFVNNHQPHEPLPEHPETSFTVEFPFSGGELTLPSVPVTVPSGAYFCWPLRLEVAGLRLEWATAQPVCTVDVDGRTVLVLAATDGIAPELALDTATVSALHTPTGDVTPVGGRLLVTGLRPGTDALVEVDTADGGRVGLLVLDAATARTAYRGHAWGAERLVLCGDGVVFDRDEVRLHGSGTATSFAVLPAPERAPVVDGVTAEAVADGAFTRYAVPKAPAGEGSTVEVTLVRAAGPAPETVTGVQGRASAPADKYFDTVAAEYRVEVPDALPPGTLLRLHWNGDVGRAYVGDTLVADQFCSGRVWDIGLDRLPADALQAGGLRLRVLPLHAGAPVHLPEQARGERETAAVTHAEWITRHTWSVRAG